MTTKTPSQRIALLEAKLARAKADERKQRTRRLIEVGAMLEPLGERVAALTAEQRKYFISRVLANWDALMGKPSRSAPGRCVSSARVRHFS